MIIFKQKFFQRFHKKLVTKLGSSETRSEASFDSNLSQSNQFDFSDYLHHRYTDAELTTIEPSVYTFLEWLVGFMEGDGCLFFREVPEDNFRKRLQFEIGQKDPAVLYRIQSILGFGTVTSFTRKIKQDQIDQEQIEPIEQIDQIDQEQIEETYWRFRVENQEHLVLIFRLLNGNLVLPKRRCQYLKCFEVFKEKKVFPENLTNKNADLHAGCSKVTLNNAWLSGFIDADGGFYALISENKFKSKKSVKIRQKFFITQKNEWDDNQVLLNIRTILKSKSKLSQILNTSKQKSTHPINESSYYRIEVQSLESHELLKSYLNEFKLKTKKLIAFRRWERLVKARQQKLHLDFSNYSKLEKLGQSINKF
nr:hypothetical protein [Uronema sp. CCAP 334/1]